MPAVARHRFGRFQSAVTIGCQFVLLVASFCRLKYAYWLPQRSPTRSTEVTEMETETQQELSGTETQDCKLRVIVTDGEQQSTIANEQQYAPKESKQSIKSLPSPRTMYTRSIPTFIYYSDTCLMERSMPEDSLVHTSDSALTTTSYITCTGMILVSTFQPFHLFTYHMQIL